jgi:predicted flap endonuclease-1-like 5' DNA nuclease
VDAERQTLADRFGSLSGLAATAPAAAGAALVAMARGESVDLEELSQEAGDDLTMIEGIGPKIQELLYQNGIHTYAELADCDVELLRAILAGGGAAFRMADPSSWPRQARLVVAHDWVRLAALKQQLTGGVRRPAEPAPEDDLTMIEGIGPKISASLKEHGIRTFAQLARTDVGRLQVILAEAGPAFKLAAPAVESWPEQARLAADGAWDQLHALKDTLRAGRGDTGEPGPQVGPGEVQ